MSKVNIHNLLNKYAKREAALMQTEILAPSLRDGQRIFTMLEGTSAVYIFEAPAFNGWGIFRPVSRTQVRLVRAAQEFERLAYLNKLEKQLRVIMIHAIKGTSWLAIPQNASDAMQKNLSGEPFILHLVEDNCKMFDYAVVKFDGANYWFQHIDRRSDPRHSEEILERFHEACELHIWDAVAKNTSPEETIAFSINLLREKANSIPKEEIQMRQQLGYLNASLVSYQPMNDDYYRVTYTDSSGEHSVTVNQNFEIVSAGICLSGLDKDFDLASIVKVLQKEDEDWR